MEGTSVGTVASELESNIEESHKTTSASDLPPVLMLAMMVLMDATMINEAYWWKGINKDIEEYCRRCDTCQRVNAKLERRKAATSEVWKQVGIDLIGPLPVTTRGNKYIITVTDYFTKWPEAASLQDKTAAGVADFLFKVFCHHGWPQVIISDQGREYVNDLSRCLFDLTEVEHRISSPYHPQTNGLDERTNQTLMRALIKFSEAKVDWDLNIDAALYAYLISKQASSQFSPFFLMYNRNPRKAIDHELGSISEQSSTNEMEESLDTLLKIRDLYHEKALTNI